MRASATSQQRALADALKRYQDGELAGFDEMYHLTSNVLYTFLMVRLRNEADAEDALQELYLKIHRNIRRWDEKRGAMAWLMTIAHNVAIDRIRSQKPTSSLEDESQQVEVASESVDRVALRSELKAMLKDLSDENERILIAKFIEEQSYDEMAKEFGLSSQSLRKRVSRLIAKLAGQ